MNMNETFLLSVIMLHVTYIVPAGNTVSCQTLCPHGVGSVYKLQVCPCSLCPLTVCMVVDVRASLGPLFVQGGWDLIETELI